MLLGGRGRLLARSGPLLGPPGGRLGLICAPGGLLLELLGPLFEALLENSENLENPSFFLVQNRAQMAPESLLAASWHLLALIYRLLAPSWRLLAASWRSWSLLGASGGALGALLTRK